MFPVLWGLLHGGFLMIHHLWHRFGPFSFPKPFAWALTFFSVTLAWIPFRATSLQDAEAYLVILFNLDAIKLPQFLHRLLSGLPGFRTIEFANMPLANFTDLIGLFCGLLIVLLAPNAKAIAVHSRGRKGYALIAGMLTGLILILLLERPSVFVYFTF